MVTEGVKGSIVNIFLAEMGHVGGENRTVYCATKHALDGPTKAMAIDLTPHASGSIRFARPSSARS
jgi:NAD(P)-dependent dehydrogenase (short-subunit alcohol dehydrogenase family)